MNDCLTETEIDQFITSDASDSSLHAGAKQHIESCDECRQRLDSEQLFRELKLAVNSPNRAASACGQSSESGGPSIRIGAESVIPEIPGYRFENKIQQGGQGDVFKAIQVATKRTVAVKFLRDRDFAVPAKRIRFEREIELVAKLKHPNIVTVYESGSIDGIVYFSMEFVDGETLDQFCEKHLKCSFKAGATSKRYIREVLSTFLKIAKSVAYAHRNGVIHRDLKPANILVNHDAEPKVLDFGLAKIADVLGSNDGSIETNKQTLAGEFLGTPAYASPEQFSEQVDLVDTRSDVYSLGVMLFESITKRFPYTVSGTLVSVAKEISFQSPEPPSKLNKAVDSDLEAIVLKSLTKDPVGRYQSAEQFANDIEAYLTGRPVEAKRNSGWYRLRKTIAQHWAISLTIFMTVMLLSVALATSNFYFRQAVRDRDIAIESQDKTAAALAAEAAQKVEADFQGYVANLAAAAGATQLHDVVGCTKRLMNVPEQMRGWEWYQFLHLLDDSIKTIANYERQAKFVSFGDVPNEVISAGLNKRIIVTNTETQETVRTLMRAQNGPIGISLDKRLIAFEATRGKVVIRRVSDFQEIASIQTGGTTVTALSFSPDSSKICVGVFSESNSAQNIAIEIWEIGTKKRQTEIPFAGWHINSISISPDEKTLAAITFDGASLWDFATGNRVAKLPDRPGNETVVQFDPKGNLVATGGKDGVIYLWSTDEKKVIAALDGHRGEVTDVVFCNDPNFLVSCSRDKTIRVWDLQKRTAIKTYQGHQWAISDLDLHPSEKKIATASWDKSIRLWEGIDAPSPTLLSAHQAQVSTVDFSPDGTLFASASRDHTVKVWRTSDRKLIHKIGRFDSPAHGVKFSHDGKLLATTGWDGLVKIFNTKNWNEVASLIGHDPRSRVHGVAYSADDKWLVTGGSDNKLLIWDLENFREIGSLVGHDDHIHTVAVSHDNLFVASAGHRSIRIWSLLDNQLLHTIPRKMIQDDYSLAFHPTENWLAAGADVGLIKLWNVETGLEVATFKGHSDEIISLDFFPDGSRLVSSSFDNRVVIWDTDSRRELLTLFGCPSPANVVKFGPGGFYLLGGLENGMIKIWKGIGVKDLAKMKNRNRKSSASR